jgi:hypothetical protein
MTGLSRPSLLKSLSSRRGGLKRHLIPQALETPNEAMLQGVAIMLVEEVCSQFLVGDMAL